MMPLAGRGVDYLGTRLGYLVSHRPVERRRRSAHALAGSALGFGMARFALGFGESANFPAALKTVANWFPRTERAFATGIFNSGANIGALVGPSRGRVPGRCTSDGDPPSSSPACSASCGAQSGSGSIASPASIRNLSAAELA